MWNNSPKYSVKDLDLNSNVNLMDKVEKSLDLTNYLKFLDYLFHKSASDSDEGEGESPKPKVPNKHVKPKSKRPSPSETKKQNTLLSSAAAESSANSSSSNSENSRGPNQPLKTAKEFPSLPHPHPAPSSQQQSSSDSSSSSSSSSDEFETNSMLQSEFAPMSDLELNNLLQKTPYLGPGVDPMTILTFEVDDTTTDSDKKKNSKKKKKKSKRKHNDGINQRQNKPNSGGKGNGPNGGFSGVGGDSGGHGVDSAGNSNSTGSSNINSGGGSTSTYNNSRARKQSLKIIRAEAEAAASSSSSSAVSPVDLQSMFPGVVVEPSLVTPNVYNPGTVFLSGFIETRPTDGNKGLPFGTYSSGLRLDDSENEDDNESLSDYRSMVATAAAPTAQVPPFSQQITISNHSVFKFDAGVVDNSSNGGKFSSDKKSSTTNSVINNHHHVQSHGKEERKRKSEVELKNCKLGSTKLKKPSVEVQKQAKLIESLNQKRRKVYTLMCKKEIAKTQRTKANSHKEMLIVKRRLAQACARVVRQKAIQSQRVMKESVWRAKRLTREMQAFWKQADKADRDVKRKIEKQQEEQRKIALEHKEFMRHQRKLRFLIVQSDLYSNCVSKKLCKKELSQEEEDTVLSHLNMDYDGERMKQLVKETVHGALKSQENNVGCFDRVTNARPITQNEEAEKNGFIENGQPTRFNGMLKNYQLKGLNWLTNLYEQGINGILADEMGLGKTVQSIAFLARIAEKHGAWGPFLVVAPTSTLHNWQQEIKRFVPDFKVVPYWGNPQERKILRQFWQKSNLSTPDATFHIVVTSCKIVMTDLKYFNRIKWQYLILDEAQVVNSTTTACWKILNGFSCRNRLLLTATPVQNTLGELWTLLNFIMPSLFDSHDDFNDWFFKEIESHAENKTLMHESCHIPRLRLILEPFMLRRIKKDVENELCEKIEILLECPLTARQRILYTALKRKIKVEGLLQASMHNPSMAEKCVRAENSTANLMNMVMEFRKICNHPDLIEKREVESPFHMKIMLDHYPKLIFRDGIHSGKSKLRIFENKFCIFHPENTHGSLFHRKVPKIAQRLSRLVTVEDIHVDNVGHYNSNTSISEWSFLRMLGISPGEMWKVHCGGILERLRLLVRFRTEISKLHFRSVWHENKDSSSLETFAYPSWKMSFPNIASSPNLQNLVFTSTTSSFYTWMDHKITSSRESLQHSSLQSKNTLSHVIQREVIREEIRNLQPTDTPKFLYNIICSKVSSEGRQPYFYDRSCGWWLERHELCSSSQEGLNYILYGASNKPPPCVFYNNYAAGGFSAVENPHGWSHIVAPDKEKLVIDSGKLKVLDCLLNKLKIDGHRVLVYSQMTTMIDLLEEFLSFRKWTYIRLDGSSKIAERRDMATDFQTGSDIFIFLLSTRADGLGINLTNADTVIFYDSDWNPSVDQQAMDRAHRLGQTKQVTVYRLICKGTIEEKILQRANEIRPTIACEGAVRLDILKPKEILTLLLDDDEMGRLKLSDKKPGVEKAVEAKFCSSNRFSSEPVRSLSLREFFSESESHYQGFEHQRINKAVGESDANTTESGLMNHIPLEVSSGGSAVGSLSPSPDLSEDMEMGDNDFQEESGYDESLMDSNLSAAYYDEYPRALEWNNGSVSDYDEDLGFIPKKPKMGRGTGKRGRPPSRVRVQLRDVESGQLPMRRGPGRPRLRPIGPANQGIRGRRPGRPPLSKKAETNNSSSLTPLTPSQRVFGMYSSPDLS